jgi:hypothetical protein
MTQDIFESCADPSGKRGGVYENTPDSGGWFYLCDNVGSEFSILGSVGMNSPAAQIHPTDVEVRWSPDGQIVGLFIQGKLWAAFDDANNKYGGCYHPQGRPDIPSHIVGRF